MAAPAHIQACMVLHDGTAPISVPIETVTIPPSTALRPRKEEPSKQSLKSRVIWKEETVSNEKNVSTPKLSLLDLPYTQPKRPAQWREKEWDHRVVVGDTHFHAFIAPPPAKKGRYRMIPGTDKLFPLQCDAFICKVVVDETSRDDFWHYEDIDPGSEKQLKEFAMRVTGILEDVGFGSDEDLWSRVVECC